MTGERARCIHRPTVHMRRSVAMVMMGLTAAGAGCGFSGPRTVYNPDPAIKIPAIVEAADRRDRSTVPELVKCLNSDDPAVRFYSIRALRDMTGEDFGYRYYEDDDARKPAVQRWRQWLSQQPQQAPAK